MSDINQMAHFAQMWTDPYGLYPLKDEKPPIGFQWAALHQVASAASLATRTVSPPQRRKANPVPTEHKDEAYYERRKKNNDSAKRSRENRKLKEQEYQIRCEALMHENQNLKECIKQLQAQVFQLRAQFSQQWPSTVLP